MSHADIGTAVRRRQRNQREGCQRVNGERAVQHRSVAGGVTSRHCQGVAAHTQIVEVKRCTKAATAGVEGEAAWFATVKAVLQLGQVGPGTQSNAPKLAGTGQRVAVGQRRDGEQRSHRVEQEAASARCADIARHIGGDDAVAVGEVGRAVQRQGRGETEMPGGVQRQAVCRAAVDADHRTGHPRQVVQHLPGDGEVGVGGGRRGRKHDLGRLHVLREGKLGQHCLRDLLADGLAGQVVRRRVDARINATETGLVSSLAEAGEASHHVRQGG